MLTDFYQIFIKDHKSFSECSQILNKHGENLFAAHRGAERREGEAQARFRVGPREGDLHGAADFSEADILAELLMEIDADG